MAGSTIANLTGGSTVTGTDAFPAVETAGTGPVKKTATQIANFVKGILGYATINTQTASYTLALGDAVGTVVEMNSSSAMNLTVPPNSSVAFPLGTVVVVRRRGTGQVTLVAGGGVTLNTPSSLTTRARYSAVSLFKRATDEWDVAGDLT